MDDRHEADTEAKQRFFLINAMRIAGVIMILLGVLVFNDVMPLPDWAGWVLLALGMIETFVTPQILARVWSTNERR